MNAWEMYHAISPYAAEEIAERAHERARVILFDVVAGYLPNDVRHPWHAYAACLYDYYMRCGWSFDAAADALGARIAAGHPPTFLESDQLLADYLARRRATLEEPEPVPTPDPLAIVGATAMFGGDEDD